MARRDYSLEEMITELRKHGENHGFAALGTAVVIVGPGAPFNVHATWYAAKDLERAADAGLLQRRRLSGSFLLDIYAVPSKRE